ncbi:hypothetical protein [Labedaea rhizosphaerae]|uniref:hypothetical protein n=1 Tax=Labedaea rhizosphaerae TaxID=598644 RepID=UPI001AAC602A|nr:hypothetical protein [Labedaea rhizosphaerae]
MIISFVLVTALCGCTTSTGGEPVPLETPPPVPHPLDIASHSFQSAVIDGYPAIFDKAPAVSERRNSGCQVMIATATKQSFQLRYDNLETADMAASCRLVTELADRVLRRLGG